MNCLEKGIIEGIVQGNKEVYNPVFFYGDPVRVRFIMDRLVKAYMHEHPQDFIYRTNGIDFVCGIIHSIKDGTIESFKNAFARAKLVVFESVEVIAGREATMELFYNLFDTVYESGGTIVLGGAKPPAQIHALEDRVRTQMEGSLLYCVDEG